MNEVRVALGLDDSGLDVAANGPGASLGGARELGDVQAEGEENAMGGFHDKISLRRGCVSIGSDRNVMMRLAAALSPTHGEVRVR